VSSRQRRIRLSAAVREPQYYYYQEQMENLLERNIGIDRTEISDREVRPTFESFAGYPAISQSQLYQSPQLARSQ
jgi:hypothetical protein